MPNVWSFSTLSKIEQQVFYEMSTGYRKIVSFFGKRVFGMGKSDGHILVHELFLLIL